MCIQYIRYGYVYRYGYVFTILQYLVCVCGSLICHLTHWNRKRDIPTDSSQYRNDKESLYFVKTICSKVIV